MIKITFFNHNDNAGLNKISGIVSGLIGANNLLELENLDALIADKSVGICIFHGWPDGWENRLLESGGALDRSPGLIVCSISSAPLGKSLTWVQGKVAEHLLFNVPCLAAAGLIGTEPDVIAKRWKEFLQVLESLRSKIAGRSGNFQLCELEPFLNPVSQAPLALRLLCEAWKATRGEATVEAEGITIHTPTTLKQWLAPFEASGDATKVAALMGKAKDAAAALFAAVEKSKEEFGETVEAFLTVTAHK